MLKPQAIVTFTSGKHSLHIPVQKAF